MEWTPDRIRLFRAAGLSLPQPKFAKELGFCERSGRTRQAVLDMRAALSPFRRRGVPATIELDAVDGTPVLDIKPWFREFGPRGTVRQAAWSSEMLTSISPHRHPAHEP